jgi:hypothetical protein
VVMLSVDCWFTAWQCLLHQASATVVSSIKSGLCHILSILEPGFNDENNSVFLFTLTVAK